jgi:hypothetical protein
MRPFVLVLLALGPTGCATTEAPVVTVAPHRASAESGDGAERGVELLTKIGAHWHSLKAGMTFREVDAVLGPLRNCDQHETALEQGYRVAYTERFLADGGGTLYVLALQFDPRHGLQRWQVLDGNGSIVR